MTESFNTSAADGFITRLHGHGAWQIDVEGRTVTLKAGGMTVEIWAYCGRGCDEVDIVVDDPEVE